MPGFPLVALVSPSRVFAELSILLLGGPILFGIPGLQGNLSNLWFGSKEAELTSMSASKTSSGGPSGLQHQALYRQHYLWLLAYLGGTILTSHRPGSSG